MKKRRKSRIAFCEWSTASFGSKNLGGIICKNCKFHRTLLKGEGVLTEKDNKADKNSKCPNCGEIDWYYLPPIARVPRKKSNKRIWKKFWKDLLKRRFNHPQPHCR